MDAFHSAPGKSPVRVTVNTRSDQKGKGRGMGAAAAPAREGAQERRGGWGWRMPRKTADGVAWAALAALHPSKGSSPPRLRPQGRDAPPPPLTAAGSVSACGRQPAALALRDENHGRQGNQEREGGPQQRDWALQGLEPQHGGRAARVAQPACLPSLVR